MSTKREFWGQSLARLMLVAEYALLLPLGGFAIHATHLHSATLGFMPLIPICGLISKCNSGLGIFRKAWYLWLFFLIPAIWVIHFDFQPHAYQQVGRTLDGATFLWFGFIFFTAHRIGIAEGVDWSILARSGSTIRNEAQP